MVRAALVSAALAVLVAAAPAAAQDTRPVAERATEPLRIAKRVFGPAQCGTPVVALGEFGSAVTLAGSDTTACDILFNARYAAEMPQAMFCTLLVHEYGHLAGHEHSANPRSVMFAYYRRADPRCVAAAGARAR